MRNRLDSSVEDYIRRGALSVEAPWNNRGSFCSEFIPQLPRYSDRLYVRLSRRTRRGQDISASSRATEFRWSQRAESETPFADVFPGRRQIGLSSKRDQHHQRAVARNQFDLRTRSTIVTTEAVLLEWLNALSEVNTRRIAAVLRSR